LRCQRGGKGHALIKAAIAAMHSKQRLACSGLLILDHGAGDFDQGADKAAADSGGGEVLRELPPHQCCRGGQRNRPDCYSTLHGSAITASTGLWTEKGPGQTE